MVQSGKGGSIAGAAFTPCGTEEGYVPLIREIVKNILVRGERALGRAIFAAKCSLITWYPTDDYYYGPAVLYTTFGDPALRIKLAQPTAVRERLGNPVAIDFTVTPNPLRGSAVVAFDLSRPAPVLLRLYDAAGVLVRTLANEEWRAGRHSVGLARGVLPAGVYFANLVVGGPGTSQLTRKLVIE